MEKVISLSDLAEAIAREKNVPQSVAIDFVNLFFNTIEESLLTEKLVKIKGLGTFKLVDVADRESIDVNTGERILIKGHSKVSFTPDSSLRDRVNRPFAAFETITLYDGTDVDEMGRVPDNNDYIDDSRLDGQSAASLNENEESVHGEVSSTSAQETVKLSDIVHDVENSVSQVKLKDSSESDAISIGQEEKSMESETLEMERSPNQTTSIPSDDITKESVELNSQDVPVESNRDSSSIESTEAEQEETDGDIPATLISSSALQTPDEEKKISKRSNLWKYLLQGFLVLLLMAISYLAGYFRLFCPTCDYLNTTKKENACKKMNKEDLNMGSDTLQVKAKKPVSKPRPEDQFAQVPGGKFLIVGTKGTRVMKVGDTLLKMAREEYGDKDFAKYIIVHNNFPNPDVIPLGYVVKLPELK